ncbi:ABC transporter permease [Longirhabdus pacifica]|uniref:ABC transporter permease n=1 Tax=Longirhabdus pacifica TaxID=2305227 RepID=UPI001009358D|nr:ABC transporter permease subunit [Longirhabdus pacifica]
MWNKALFRKDYKQTKFILWAIVLICILALPLNTAVKLEQLRVELEEEDYNKYYFLDEESEIVDVDQYTVESIYRRVLDSSIQLTNILLFIMIVLLASVMIGAERGNKTNDFTFSLPFRRKQIFLSKWMLGSTVVAASYIVNYFLAHCIIYFSEFGSYLHWDLSLYFVVYSLVALLAMYTFSLCIGTFTGGVIYQIAVSVIFLIFPMGIILLLASLFDAHTASSYVSWNEWAFLRGLERVSYDIFLFQYNMNLQGLLYDFNHRWFDIPIQEMKASYIQLLIPLGYIAAFVPLGVLLYEKGNIEHNGKFILFDKLQSVFHLGMVVCFALLGGMLVSDFTPYNLRESRIYFYYAGFIGAGLLFYFISRKLLNMKLQLFSK